MKIIMIFMENHYENQWEGLEELGPNTETFKLFLGLA